MKTKRPLQEARIIAERVVDWLQPACARIEIAGSIRHQCPVAAGQEGG